MNGLKSSSGKGRISVDERSEDISSIVCRKRSWIVMGFSLMPLTVDTCSPALRIVSARHRKDGRTAVRLWLSEAATVRLRYGSPAWRGTRTLERQAGYSSVVVPRATRVRAQAVDAAANSGSRVTVHLGG